MILVRRLAVTRGRGVLGVRAPAGPGGDPDRQQAVEHLLDETLCLFRLVDIIVYMFAAPPGREFAIDIHRVV